MIEKPNISEYPQGESTSIYKELFNEAKNDSPHLPEPNLEDAIETAFGDILVSNSVESNELNTAIYDKNSYATQEIRAVHEKEYLEATLKYLNDCLAVAEEHEPEDIAYDWHGRGPANETYAKLVQDIKEFKENLVYINNVEFEKATEVMAERIVADAEAGNIVGVFSYADRSPQYVCVKVLDKVRRILESASNYNPDEAERIKGNIVYSDSANGLVRDTAKRNQQDDAPIKMYVVDDFLVSGNRMRGGITRLTKTVDAIVGSQDGIRIQGLVICAVPNEEDGYPGQKIDVDAVYQPKSGETRTSMAMAGSWSSTDYGYENELDKFAERTKIVHPLSPKRVSALSSHRIKGRYEQDQDGNYLDPQYAEEVEKTKATFGVDPTLIF